MIKISKYISAKTEMHYIVWETVKLIPKGKVSTYGNVAIISGLIGQARRVGSALHDLPPRSEIPWHRVVNSRGKISLPKVGGYCRRQTLLLQKEGIEFTRGKINMKRFGWPTWLQKRPRSMKIR